MPRSNSRAKCGDWGVRMRRCHAKPLPPNKFWAAATCRWDGMAARGTDRTLRSSCRSIGESCRGFMGATKCERNSAAGGNCSPHSAAAPSKLRLASSDLNRVVEGVSRRRFPSSLDLSKGGVVGKNPRPTIQDVPAFSRSVVQSKLSKSRNGCILMYTISGRLSRPVFWPPPYFSLCGVLRLALATLPQPDPARLARVVNETEQLTNVASQSRPHPGLPRW